MTRLDALRALYDGIDANASRFAVYEVIYQAFPNAEHRDLIVMAMDRSDLRAVGAALAFLAAKLPEAIVHDMSQDNARRWWVVLATDIEPNYFYADHEVCATALLLAGLAAHIAMEEGK